MSDFEDLEPNFGDIENALGRVETAVEQVETAVKRVETAVEKVEAAVKNKWSAAQWLIWVLVGFGALSFLGDIWHSKWRYAMYYGASSGKVEIEKHPHDCNFLAAPLGEKYCEYEREVLTI